MDTNNISPKILQDVKINIKIKLAALWVVLMFCYTYADILGFYAPGNLEELISGEIAGVRITPEMLLGSALLMVIPSVMVFMSLILTAKANRLVNIVAGVIYLIVLGGTFFTGRNPSYYLFYAAVKAMLLALIIWLAWRWPQKDV